MLKLVFIAQLLLAVSQISTQSPIQDVTPVTGLTTVATTQSIHNRRDSSKRDTLDHSITTKTHILPSITPSLTTSASTAIPTKNLKNCNVEGIPTSYLVSNILDLVYAYDASACQANCMGISRCEAYSWQMPVSTGSNNCVFYSTLIDGDKKVKASNISGIFFSDKYPSDQSNFCYGSVEL
jgi:hypothetical protein